MGKLLKFLMGEFLWLNINPGSSVVNVQINPTLISNTLIEIGVTINFMTQKNGIPKTFWF